LDSSLFRVLVRAAWQAYQSDPDLSA
jgi:hypothetical protein